MRVIELLQVDCAVDGLEVVDAQLAGQRDEGGNAIAGDLVDDRCGLPNGEQVATQQRNDLRRPPDRVTGERLRFGGAGEQVGERLLGGSTVAVDDLVRYRGGEGHGLLKRSRGEHAPNADPTGGEEDCRCQAEAAPEYDSSAASPSVRLSVFCSGF